MKKIVYLPLDERPCNYSFCQFVVQDNNEIKLVCPPLTILGNKKQPANHDEIVRFLTEQCVDADYLIIAVDMLLYGGLVPSRLHEMSVDEVSSRAKLLQKLKQNNPRLRTYAFSLVMRCPTYSSSDEEPDYYEQYGERIFNYGVNEHKFSDGLVDEQTYLYQKQLLNVPKNVIEDYTKRRKVNLSVLKEVLKFVGGAIDEFVILQDDSNPYGFTAMDQRVVKQVLTDNDIQVDIHPGGDEGGLTLLARVLAKIKGHSPKICPVFPKPECMSVVPLFEDRAVYKSICSQIQSAGCTVATEDDAEIYLFCNLPVGQMKDVLQQNDEHCDASYNDRGLTSFVSKLAKLHVSGKAVAIADIAYANGGDVEFARMVSDKVGLLNTAGYAGWNTSSNTLGTVICQTVFYCFYGNTPTHKRFTAERVYEDIAYCSYARMYITTNLLPERGMNYFNVVEARGFAASNAKKISEQFVAKYLPEISAKYVIDDCFMPWKRMFEVGFTVKEKN